MGGICLAWCCGVALVAADTPVRPDQPYAVTFPAQEAKFVRFVIRASSSGEPCVDELEVFAADGNQNLALAERGAKATASSCLSGYTKHQIPHLNDGRYGNEYSWIAASPGEEWAQIELPAVASVGKVVFSRDRTRHYADRVPIHFAVQLSLDGDQWNEVKEISTTAVPVAVIRRHGSFSGVVPNAPPPPVVTPTGQILSAEPPADLKVPDKDDLGFPNLALNPRAKPAASSLLPGHAIHQVAHLNDGLAGNEHSWISGEDPSWAEIDLGDVHWVYQVALASDNSRQYSDRAATTFSILTATEYNEDSAASTWSAAHRQSAGPPVQTRRTFKFEPVRARWVRIAVEAVSRNQVRIDEIEIFGQSEPIAAERIGPIPKAVLAASPADMEKHLRDAFLGEEHAWLKTHGRADLDRRLTETPYREKRYPRHVAGDRLPLPLLAGLPECDGRLDDPCWNGASRGVVRVAHPRDFDEGPLVTTDVWAGRTDDELVLALRTDRLLSSHLAVVSSTDGRGCGVVAYTPKGLVLNTYEPEGRGTKLTETIPVEGAIDASLTRCEFRLPLDQFPDCAEQGIRVGLGMGGKHTLPEGRAVSFTFSPLSVAELSPCVNRTFRVRLAVAPGAKPVKLRGVAPGLKDELTLNPGESKILSIPAEAGPIGPRYDLEIDDDSGSAYAVHLFRYDPLEPTLALLEAMIDRFATKGLDVATERGQLARFRDFQATLLASDTPDPAAERKAFFEARLAKRQLFLREPDLALIEDILFVKRHAFEPSHNYSVILDSRFRPGGGVYTIHIPRREGRFRPDESTLNRLFDAGEGIPRNPMANFDLTKIYFA
ncbi:MAG: discoidin domain-containing protein, partial [Planctomycetes bacterium]|nr:discoidin domain-containing protein [Planctomycetota bacterium]